MPSPRFGESGPLLGELGARNDLNRPSSQQVEGTMLEFLSNVKTYGLAKTNRFLVRLQPPTSLKAGPSLLKRIGIFAHTVPIPDLEIFTQRARVHGTSLELPTDFQRGSTIDITFYVDSARTSINLFEKWAYEIVNPNSYDLSYSDEYSGQMDVHVIDYKLINSDEVFKKTSFIDDVKTSFLQSFDPDKYRKIEAIFEEHTVCTYRFFNIFPKKVNVSTLSYGSTEVQNMTVTFAYEKMICEYNYDYKKDDTFVTAVPPEQRPSQADKIFGRATDAFGTAVKDAAGTVGSVAGIFNRLGG